MNRSFRPWTRVGLLAVLAVSLAVSRGPTTRTTLDGKVILTFPDGWRDYSREGATLAVQDDRGRVFLWVHTDDKSDFVDMTLEEYAKWFSNHTDTYLQNSEHGELKPVDVGGWPGIEVEVHGVQERIRWTYTHVLVETPGYYHALLFATRPSAAAEGRAAMKQILATFKEVNPEDAADAPTAAPATAPATSPSR